MRETKDSGKRQHFNTGARRDTQEGKVRMSQLDMTDYYTMFMDSDGVGGSEIDFDNSKPLETGWDEDGGNEFITMLLWRIFCFLMNWLSPRNGITLIHPLYLNRTGAVLWRGMIKYGKHNWQKGIPLSRIYDSHARHQLQIHAGDTSEDHAAACSCNDMFYMITEHMIDTGQLPRELADHGALQQKLQLDPE